MFPSETEEVTHTLASQQYLVPMMNLIVLLWTSITELSSKTSICGMADSAELSLLMPFSPVSNCLFAHHLL